MMSTGECMELLNPLNSTPETNIALFVNYTEIKIVKGFTSFF